MYHRPPHVWVTPSGLVAVEGGSLALIPFTVKESNLATVFGSRVAGKIAHRYKKFKALMENAVYDILDRIRITSKYHNFLHSTLNLFSTYFRYKKLNHSFDTHLLQDADGNIVPSLKAIFDHFKRGNKYESVRECLLFQRQKAFLLRCATTGWRRRRTNRLSLWKPRRPSTARRAMSWTKLCRVLTEEPWQRACKSVYVQSYFNLSQCCCSSKKLTLKILQYNRDSTR